MKKFFVVVQRFIAVFACWSVLGGIALSQAQQGDNAPEHNAHGPACWPAPCVASEDPDGKHLFGNYFIPPRMEWYSEFDIVAYQANAQAATTLATLAGNPVLTTGNFGWDMQLGGRALVGCTLDECWQVEGQFSEIDTSDNNALVRNETANSSGGTGNLMTPFGGFGASPIVGIDRANFASVHYTDSFQNGEINLRRQMPTPPGRLTMSIFCGVRYTDVREEMEFDTVTMTPPASGGAANNFHVHTDNEMIGGQIGALFEFWIENRWWLDFEAKGVFYSNQATLTTTYTNLTAAGTTVYSNTDQETHTTYAEDLTVTLVYRWSPHVATRLGYQAIFMQDVALAPENLPFDINTVKFGPVQVNHSQTMIYQGPVAGLMIAW